MNQTIELPRETWARARSEREVERVAVQGGIRKYARKGWFARLFARVARRKRR